MGTVARHNHATDNVKSEGVQKVFSRLGRRKQNLPVSASAKALAKRKETSPGVSTVEAVLLSAKLVMPVARGYHPRAADQGSSSLTISQQCANWRTKSRVLKKSTAECGVGALDQFRLLDARKARSIILDNEPADTMATEIVGDQVPLPIVGQVPAADDLQAAELRVIAG
jgi:hypothetical protein